MVLWAIRRTNRLYFLRIDAESLFRHSTVRICVQKICSKMDSKTFFFYFPFLLSCCDFLAFFPILARLLLIWFACLFQQTAHEMASNAVASTMEESILRSDGKLSKNLEIFDWMQARGHMCTNHTMWSWEYIQRMQYPQNPSIGPLYTFHPVHI